jgi:hypothetical protein
MSSTEIPTDIMKELDEMVETTGIPKDEVIDEFKEALNSKTCKDDSQFESPSEKYNYALEVVYSHLVSRPPARRKKVIPIGIEEPRPTKSGMRSSLFVLHRTKKDSPLTVELVAFYEKYIDRTKSIIYGMEYVPKLIVFKEGKGLQGDSRAKFENPSPTKMTLKEILNKLLKVPTINITQAMNSPKARSRKDAQGYVDTKDWRKIVGTISNKFKFQRKKDKTTGHGLTIIDRTVKERPKTRADGSIDYPGLTVWVSEQFYNTFDPDDYCEFYGSINEYQGKVTMNGYQIILIHGGSRYEEESDEEI